MFLWFVTYPNYIKDHFCAVPLGTETPISFYKRKHENDMLPRKNWQPLPPLGTITRNNV